MLQPRHQERWILLQVERLVLADAEEYGRTAEMLPSEELGLGGREQVLGPLGEVGRYSGDGVGRTAAVELFGNGSHQTAEGCGGGGGAEGGGGR